MKHLKLITLFTFALLLLPYSVYAKKQTFTPPETPSGVPEIHIETNDESLIRTELTRILSNQNYFLVDSKPGLLVYETSAQTYSIKDSLHDGFFKSELVQQFGNQKRTYKMNFNLILTDKDQTRVVMHAYKVRNPGTSIEEAIDESKKKKKQESYFDILEDLKLSISKHNEVEELETSNTLK